MLISFSLYAKNCATSALIKKKVDFQLAQLLCRGAVYFKHKKLQESKVFFSIELVMVYGVFFKM